jgi:hypothetical protein
VRMSSTTANRLYPTRASRKREPSVPAVFDLQGWFDRRPLWEESAMSYQTVRTMQKLDAFVLNKKLVGIRPIDAPA